MFKDLIVWQKSMELVKAVYALTKAFPVDERYALTDQLRRAVVSIPSNIAEGFVERFVESLGRAFAVEVGEVERRIGVLAAASVGRKYKMTLSEDPRWNLRDTLRYVQEFETVEGARPRRSGIGEDCCYHAMMRVADGLSRSQVVVDSGAWEKWRRLNGLARTDGLWLADVVEKIADADARAWIRMPMDNPAFFPLRGNGSLVVEGVVRARDFTSGWCCSMQSGLHSAGKWTCNFGEALTTRQSGLDYQDPAAGGVEYLRLGVGEDLCRELSLSESYFSSCDEDSAADPRPRVWGRLRTVDLGRLCAILARRKEELAMRLQYAVLKNREEIEERKIGVRITPDEYMVSTDGDKWHAYPISAFLDLERKR